MILLHTFLAPEMWRNERQQINPELREVCTRIMQPWFNDSLVFKTPWHGSNTLTPWRKQAKQHNLNHEKRVKSNTNGRETYSDKCQVNFSSKIMLNMSWHIREIVLSAVGTAEQFVDSFGQAYGASGGKGYKMTGLALNRRSLKPL